MSLLWMLRLLLIKWSQQINRTFALQRRARISVDEGETERFKLNFYPNYYNSVALFTKPNLSERH